MADPSSDIKALDATLTSIEKVLDVPKLREELVDLEEQAGMPGLWDDQDKAQRITGRMSAVQADLKRVDSYRQRLEDLGVLYEMASEEADEATATEADAEL
ncbi:MAG TPA: PCRF domain-containing protein, partial [Mycobacteriales bacterium]|nr:PCRF domain-containing protein [Mycobacteriales bacterium]